MGMKKKQKVPLFKGDLGGYQKQGGG